MKKIFLIFCSMLISLAVIAQVPESKINELPQGTFKKTRSGKIVHYDKSGKKIGIYKNLIWDILELKI